MANKRRENYNVLNFNTACFKNVEHICIKAESMDTDNSVKARDGVGAGWREAIGDSCNTVNHKKKSQEKNKTHIV